MGLGHRDHPVLDILSVAGKFGFMSDGTQFLTDANGAKLAAVIPIEECEELMEDLDDLAVLAERREEPRASREDVKRRRTLRSLPGA
jgi:hypothetical protein